MLQHRRRRRNMSRVRQEAPLVLKGVPARTPSPQRQDHHPTILDLPDAILIDIFSRIGNNSPLPSRATSPSSPSPSATSAVSLPRWALPVHVTHPILCALVCRHWACLAPSAVCHLSFLNATLGLNFLQQFHRFTALRSLRLESVTVTTLAFTLYAPASGSNFLLILARSTPALEALEFASTAEKMHRDDIVTMLIQALPLWASLRRLWLGDLLSHLHCKFAHRLMVVARDLATIEDLSLEFSWEKASVMEAFQGKIGWLTALRTLSLCCPSLQGFQAESFRHLSSLSVSGLDSEELPDSMWGDLPSLEWLRLANCLSLSELPSTLQMAPRLTELQLEELPSLTALPDWLGELRSLQDLRVVNCQSLSSDSDIQPLPESIGMLNMLRTLHLEHCHWLREIPDSVTGLTTLERLSLAHCVMLQRLPEGLSSLTRLRVLSLLGCLSLLFLPNTPGDLTALEELQLSFSPVITRLPKGFGGLSSLRCLFLWRCQGLKALPKCIGKLKSLRSLTLEECPTLSTIPPTLTRLENLQVLQLTRCCSLRNIPEDFSAFAKLRRIVIWDCPAIMHAPQIPRHLIHFKAATESG